MISVDMVDAVKVQFLKQIFEEDFVEKGMKAWLTDVEWWQPSDCYRLYFDFTDFEAENLKYFKESFYANKFTQEQGLPEKPYYTAIEAGEYRAKYWVYFGVSSDRRDDELFKTEILAYLRVVE
jgi:hypothetical protein